jgi:hypothetical protein
MSDKLLIEVEMANGDAEEAVRALVFLANELIEYSPLEIREPIEWKQKAGDYYRLKWRFSEDALSSWQVTLNADLVVQLTDALRAAQLALDTDRGKRKNNTFTVALDAIQKARHALTETIIQTEPKLESFFCEA